MTSLIGQIIRKMGWAGIAVLGGVFIIITTLVGLAWLEFSQARDDRLCIVSYMHNILTGNTVPADSTDASVRFVIPSKCEFDPSDQGD